MSGRLAARRQASSRVSAGNLVGGATTGAMVGGFAGPLGMGIGAVAGIAGGLALSLFGGGNRQVQPSKELLDLNPAMTNEESNDNALLEKYIGWFTSPTSFLSEDRKKKLMRDIISGTNVTTLNDLSKPCPEFADFFAKYSCLLYTSPSPRD